MTIQYSMKLFEQSFHGSISLLTFCNTNINMEYKKRYQKQSEGWLVFRGLQTILSILTGFRPFPVIFWGKRQFPEVQGWRGVKALISTLGGHKERDKKCPNYILKQAKYHLFLGGALGTLFPKFWQVLTAVTIFRGLHVIFQDFRGRSGFQGIGREIQSPLCRRF